MKKAICTILSFLFVSALFAQEAEKIFSARELQEDFKILRNRYEQNLANLYLYTSKPELDRVFDSLYTGIGPMTARTFYSHISILSSVIKDGHANLYPAYAFQNTDELAYFPFDVFWDGHKMVVEKNFSGQSGILPGHEILFINGKPITEIMRYLMKRQVRDGMNLQYPRWVLSEYFKNYYGYHFGHAKEHTISVNDGTAVYETKVMAQTKPKMAELRLKLWPLHPEKPNFQLAINDSTKIASVVVNDWNDKKFRKKADAVFKEIQEKGAKYLVIDFRGNQGGNGMTGVYLMSWLMQNNFEYLDGDWAVKRHHSDGQELKRKRWKALGSHKPQKNAFTGAVYVLTDGGCFSNTAIFCSRLKHYKRAILVGEETGGNKAVFSSVTGMKFFTTLPHTKILCENANTRLVVSSLEENNGHGVTPDHTFTDLFIHHLDSCDRMMKFTHDLITNIK